MSQGAKQSIYLPHAMFEEIRAEAARQQRSISWVVQRAWLLAAPELKTQLAPPTVEAIR